MVAMLIENLAVHEMSFSIVFSEENPHGPVVFLGTPQGNTPLHEAAKDGHKAALEELIAAGAKLDAKNKKGTVRRRVRRAKRGGWLVCIMNVVMTWGEHDIGTALAYCHDLIENEEIRRKRKQPLFAENSNAI